MSLEGEKEILRAMQLMNRNVETLDDKANLSINDSESMNSLSRLERDIVLADPQGINEELQSLITRSNAEVVMQILERDLQSIGINCSWTKGQQSTALNLRSGDSDLTFSAPGAVAESADVRKTLKTMVGLAVLKARKASS